MTKYNTDVKILLSELAGLPTKWDGRASILELKEANYNWLQMEWGRFYFEYKVRNVLAGKEFQMPGDRRGKANFDLKGEINWDIKATAVKTNNQKIILNDIDAMDGTVKQHKYHGEIIAFCDVEYDVDRTFQKWHSELKGGDSKYEQASQWCYGKTKTELGKIVLLLIERDNIDVLDKHQRGRNSNGAPRNLKYMLDVDDIDEFTNYEITFDAFD